MDSAPHTWLMLSLLGYVAGIGAGLLCWRADKLANACSFGCAALAAGGGLVSAIGGLIRGTTGGHPAELWLAGPFPGLQFTINLDPLGLFFVLIVSLLGLALSIYSLGYMRGYYGRKSVGAFGALFNAVLLTTTLVFLADNAFSFSWRGSS